MLHDPRPLASAAKNLPLRRQRKSRLRTEWVLSILLTVFLVCLHTLFFFTAGALWRDEITTLDIAIGGSLGNLWANLHHDSFPILWHLILRLWCGAGLGASDQSLRILGLIVGVGIVAALWRNARKFRTTPVVSLVLFGFANANLCYLDSLRAYGIGVLLGLLAIGSVWDVSQSATPRRIFFALFWGLLSVQSVYYDSIVLFAACIGSMCVCTMNGRFRHAVIVLMIGVVCAASMLVYINVIEQRGEVATAFTMPITLWHLFAKQQESVMQLPIPGAWVVRTDVIWIVTAATGIAMGIISRPWAKRSRNTALPNQSTLSRDCAMFTGVTLFVGLAAYWGFLYSINYMMQPWYFVAALAMVATCLDGLFATSRWPPFRNVVFSLLTITVIVNSLQSWQSAGVRMTNVDEIAESLAQVVKPIDLTVVTPWWLGVTMQRYQHRSINWTTLPAIRDLSFQRSDLFLRALGNKDTVSSVLDQVAATLRKGDRVWIITDWPLLLYSASYGFPPTKPTGSFDLPYLHYWNILLVRKAARYGSIEGPFSVGDPKHTLRFESCLLYEVQPSDASK